MSQSDSSQPLRRASVRERCAAACAALLAHAGEGGWTCVAARAVQGSVDGAVGASVWWFELPAAPVGASIGLSPLVPMPEYQVRPLLKVRDRVGARGQWISDGTWMSSGYGTLRAAAGVGEFVRADWTVEGHARVIAQVDLDPGVSGAQLALAVETLGSMRALLLAGAREAIVEPRLRRAALMERVPRAARAAVPLLVAGKTEREIAKLLHKSGHTVHDYVKCVYHALRVGTRYELLRLWLGIA